LKNKSKMGKTIRRKREIEKPKGESKNARKRERDWERRLISQWIVKLASLATPVT